MPGPIATAVIMAANHGMNDHEYRYGLNDEWYNGVCPRLTPHEKDVWISDTIARHQAMRHARLVGLYIPYESLIDPI